jgi:hypothetical protein
MWLSSIVRAVSVLGLTMAVIADDVSGGHAGSAVAAWARNGGPGDLAQVIEQRIGRSRIERMATATTALTALAREPAAQASTALLRKLSGEDAAARLAQLVDQQIDAGGGLKIIVSRPAPGRLSRRQPKDPQVRQIGPSGPGRASGHRGRTGIG